MNLRRLAFPALPIAITVLAGCSKSTPPADTKPAAASSAAAATTAAPSYPVPTTKEAATSLLATALADAQKPTPACNALASHAVATALALAAPDDAAVKASEAGYVALARCAEKARAYHLLMSLAAALADADPEGGHPELVGRALIGFGDYREAADQLQQAESADPKSADVSLTLAKLLTHQAYWSAGLQAADDAIAKLGALDSKDKKETAWRAEKYRARALLHLGKLADAEHAVANMTADGAPDAETKELLDRVALAKSKNIVVDVAAGPRVPLGDLALFGQGALPRLVTVAITNVTPQVRDVRIETAIADVTAPQASDLRLPANGRASSVLDPAFAPGFDPQSVTKPTPAKLTVHVVDPKQGSAALYDASLDVTLDPVDTVPLVHAMEPDGSLVQATPELVAARTKKPPKDLLDRARKGVEKLGATAKSVDQARVVFDLLKGMTFTPAPIGDETLPTQAMRSPEAVAAARSGTTLEGAVLAASLLGKVGCKPRIVLAPDRILVGWAPAAGEAEAEGYYVDVEKAGAGFDAALAAGKAAYEAERDAHHFDAFHGGPPLSPIVFVKETNLALATGGGR